MNITINCKMFVIITSAVIGVGILLLGIGVGVQNHIIALEEQVSGAGASVEAQEKRRVDLVQNLVDTVKDYADFEHDTQLDTIAARTKGGTIDANGEGAAIGINAVAEAYPDLKASEQYRQLMTELSTTENLIFTYRDNEIRQIRNYNKYVRQFPATFVIRATGYEVIDYKYPDYGAPADAPQNLFEE